MGDTNEEWPVIGIDLGTSHSCVSIWQHGHVEIIVNGHGNRTTPSQVSFTNKERHIGEVAENQSRTNPSNTIFDAKRLIGRKFHDEMVQKDMRLWPFKVVEDPGFEQDKNPSEVIEGPDFEQDKRPSIVVTYKGEEKYFMAEEISAMVLMKMKDTAEAYLGMPVNNAVVTVPAYFNDSQRQATKDAGTIAGLNVVRIINEPTAAAIGYCFEKNFSNNRYWNKRIVLVFDLGGGTFDVSLVSIERDKFEVKAVGGDPNLGGGDFNSRMVSHFVDKFKASYNKDVSQNVKAIGRLRVACEKAKKELSLLPQTKIEIASLSPGIDFSSNISRTEFEKMNNDLFMKCIKLVKQCLSDADIDKTDVDDIVLVGGSTRIPKVQHLVQELFDGKVLTQNINADEAVAYGAAVYAAVLCGKINDKFINLVDVAPLSLWWKDDSGKNFDIVNKNTAIPLQTVHWSTIKEGRLQSDPKIITLYEGERDEAQENNILGTFELCVESSLFVPFSLVIIFFDIDLNGIVNVSVQDTTTGFTSEIPITYRSRIPRTVMVRMIEKAQEYKAQDKKYERMVEAKNALEDYANDMDEKFSNSRYTVAKDGIQRMLEWIDTNSEQVLDVAKYEENLNKLKRICEQ